MQTYEFYILADNEDGVLTSVCNVFASRGFSIDSVAAQPINDEKTISSIKITIDLLTEKLPCIREKILQVIPVRSVKVDRIERVF